MADEKYVNLGTVAGIAKDGIISAEAVLTTALNSIKQGTSVGIGDLFELQYKMSAYTISANTFSSVLKEFSDTMKSVVQKST
jgi:hypothetical protein